MPRRHVEARPGFFRQGVLILLPVVLLAVVGTSALRQDRRMAEAEARERAQQFADDLARRVLLALETDRDPAAIKTGSSAPGPDSWFKLTSDGQIAFPGPYEAVPEPAPQELTSLNAAQRQLWEEALRADRPLAGREAGLREFLRANPVSNFISRADALLGAALLEQSRTNEALECFGRALTRADDVRGDSGVPLNDLLLLRLLRLYPASSSVFTNVASRMIAPGDPPTDGLTYRTSLALVSASAVAPMLVEAADDAGLPLPPGTGATMWRQYWQALQEARSFARGWEKAVGSEGRHSPPRFVWVTNETHWLAARVGRPASDANRAPQVIVGFFETNAVARIAAAIAGVKDLPEHLGVSAMLAGQPVLAADRLMFTATVALGKGGGSGVRPLVMPLPPSILASAVRSESGVEFLRVNLHLTSPELMFARQRQRTTLFGGLITVSVIAAIVGFVSAWRAFYKQQRLAEMKSDFVSSVSHELRAPLASVRLMAESLERGHVGEPAKQREYFGFIVQECRRLSALVENVLDFSRIEQGRKQYEFEPTDLVALVQQTVKLLEPAAGEKRLTLAVQINAARFAALDPQPSVDSRAIQQALVNLIDNALKHSPPDSTVTIGLSAGVESMPSVPGDWQAVNQAPGIMLYVEDHGSGIPAEDHARIFERFYRRGSELRRETQGVGIGLSIVKHIVEAHGGRVTVRSDVGQGSRFTIELPFSATGRTNEN